MATIARIVQINGVNSDTTNSYFHVYYFVVDTVSGSSGERVAIDVTCPNATPGTWKDLMIQAVIGEAAVGGYSLVASSVQWPATEPGDYKAAFHAVNWTKDITKTNLPAIFTNVYVGAAGEGQLYSSGGTRQYRLVIHVNKVGTGTQDAGLMDVTNAANVIFISDAAAAGEHTLDSGWVDLPAWMKGDDIIIKPVARSSVTTDDPIYHQFALYLR